MVPGSLEQRNDVVPRGTVEPESGNQDDLHASEPSTLRAGCHCCGSTPSGSISSTRTPSTASRRTTSSSIRRETSSTLFTRVRSARKRVVEGQRVSVRVDHGGARCYKKKNKR